MSTNKTPLLPVIMMILLFGVLSFVTNLAAPMGIIVKEQFHASNFLGILGYSANFIAYACMGIPAGRLLQKTGYRKTALTGIAVGFAGVAIQFLSGVTGHFIVYLSGAFVAGGSMCILNTVVNPMLNTLGGGGNKGNQLIQVGGSFYSFMGIVTPVLVGALIGQVTKDTVISNVNPLLFMAMGTFLVLFAAMALTRIPEPHLAETSSRTAGQNGYSVWSCRHFVLGAVGISASVGIEVGIPGTMILFLADMSEGIGGGLSAASTGFVAGTYFLLMFAGRLIGASIGAKVSGRAMLSAVSGAGIIMIGAAIFLPVTTLVSFPVFTGSSFSMIQVPVSAFFLILTGLCTSVMWGSIYNLAVNGLGKHLTAASGIFMMMVGGGGVMLMLQNWIADQASYMTSYWIPLAGFAYLLFYAVKGSKPEAVI
jgi:FHS family L-fucose permease-like MFS transporter